MGCDTITELPDSLLTQILLNLETKDSVKTSVLSTRWRNLWLSVPGLDLRSYHFLKEEVYASFMDRFMEFNHRSHLQNFKIKVYEHCYKSDCYRDRFMELIGTVVDRGIQHLDIYLYHRYGFIRQNIYKSKTLVSLKLDNVGLTNPEFVVSLPCLKIMHLLRVCYGKDGPLIVEKLISGCPLLEDLQLIRPFYILNEKDVMLFLPVSSQTLKFFLLIFAINRGDTDFTVEIDAPRLEYLRLSDIQSDRIVAKNLSSLLMIDFDLNGARLLWGEDLRKRNIFCDLLTGILSVRHMIISDNTLKVLYSYSKLGLPIPNFNNLYHLQANFYISSWQLLVAFLEICPNLKNLILCFCYSEEPRQIDFTNVPRCLISTLEYVEIRKWMTKDENEIKLVNYFLEKSAVLKKLTLSLMRYPCITSQEADSYKKLLTSAKLSPICQVIFE